MAPGAPPGGGHGGRRRARRGHVHGAQRPQPRGRHAAIQPPDTATGCAASQMQHAWGVYIWSVLMQAASSLQLTAVWSHKVALDKLRCLHANFLLQACAHGDAYTSGPTCKQCAGTQALLAGTFLPAHACTTPCFVAAPFRIGEATLRIHDLKLRLHTASTIAQPSPEVCLCLHTSASCLSIHMCPFRT